MGSTDTKNHLALGTPRSSPSGKTKIWSVNNVTLNEYLGTISWHGPWRKYVFQSGALIMDATCARQIAALLEEAMDDYRHGRLEH